VAQGDAPNILFIIADDHRASALGCYGNADVQTPHLDRLAMSGRRFSEVRCQGGMTGAICAPSRACVLTGRQLFEATAGVGLESSGAGLPREGAGLLPEVLRESGYFTWCIGKWHSGRAALARGFDGGDSIFLGGMADHWAVPIRSFGEATAGVGAPAVALGRFSTEVFREAACQFFQRVERRRPWFLWLAFTAPHDPRTPPPPWDGYYDPARLLLPSNVLSEHPFDNGELDIRDERLLPRPREEDAVRRELAAYYGMVSSLDDAVGAVIDAAEDVSERPLVVVYTADHGLALGSHGLLGKQNQYEHSLKVPLIIAAEELGNGVDDRVWYNSDVAGAVAALAGIPGWQELGSGSMLGDGPGREFACAAYKDVQRSIRMGPWKYIDYRRSRSSGVGSDRWQLFNLDDDPDEIDDLSGKVGESDEVRRLREVLRTWQVVHGDPWVRWAM